MGRKIKLFRLFFIVRRWNQGKAQLSCGAEVKILPASSRNRFRSTGLHNNLYPEIATNAPCEAAEPRQRSGDGITTCPQNLLRQKCPLNLKHFRPYLLYPLILLIEKHPVFLHGFFIQRQFWKGLQSDFRFFSATRPDTPQGAPSDSQRRILSC